MKTLGSSIGLGMIGLRVLMDGLKGLQDFSENMECKCRATVTWKNRTRAVMQDIRGQGYLGNFRGSTRRKSCPLRVESLVSHGSENPAFTRSYK